MHACAAVTRPRPHPNCRRLQAAAAAHFHVARTAAAKLGAVHRILGPPFLQAWLAGLLNIALYAPPQLVGEEFLCRVLPAARASVSLQAHFDKPQPGTPPCTWPARAQMHA